MRYPASAIVTLSLPPPSKANSISESHTTLAGTFRDNSRAIVASSTILVKPSVQSKSRSPSARR
jgi:hypothetical protein